MVYIVFMEQKKSLHFAQFDGRRVLKSIDARRMSVQSVLSFPTVDYAGDIVIPAGGKWDDRPYVNREHNETIGFGDVEMKSLTGEGVVPVGTSYFNQADPLANQVFRLIQDGVMTGVSIEFKPIVYKSLGHKSAIENRDAMRFEKWRGLGWAHCFQPVHPDARVLLPEIEDAVGKAIRIEQSGKLGSENLLPIVKKSLSAFAQRLRPKTKTFRVEKAVMDDQSQMFDQTEGNDMAGQQTAAEPEQEQGQPTYPTAAAGYDFAQALLDACSALESAIESAEHVDGREKLLKLCDTIKTVAEDANQIASDVETELGGGGDTEEPGEMPEGMESEESEPEPIELTQKGLIVTKSGYVPKRFRPSDFQAVSKSLAEEEAEAAKILKRIAKRVEYAERMARSRRMF